MTFLAKFFCYFLTDAVAGLMAVMCYYFRYMDSDSGTSGHGHCVVFVSIFGNTLEYIKNYKRTTKELHNCRGKLTKFEKICTNYNITSVSFLYIKACH